MLPEEKLIDESYRVNDYGPEPFAELSTGDEDVVADTPLEEKATLVLREGWQLRKGGGFEHQEGVIVRVRGSEVDASISYAWQESVPLMAVQRHGSENGAHGLSLYIRGLTTPEEAVRLLDRHGTDPAEQRDCTVVLATGEVRESF